MLNINQHSLESLPKQLPIHALRWEVQKVIEHYAEVFQCPRDFIISAVFGVVGTMCGRHVTIFDGKYRNHPNLWICHVAPSWFQQEFAYQGSDATDESRRKQTL